MTTHAEPIGDVLGLTGTFPRPGWIVLDAIRDHRFTGEVVFATTPEVRVYADRGGIYLAERPSDPSLGARLVDAGALNAAQLQHGAMRIGDAEHLGRLFARVPSVDRHQVMVVTELMTEECIGWLAGQKVGDVAVTPYRHHPSGVHRWERLADAADLAPGDPLPAPAPGDAPVAVSPPEPLFRSVDDLGDVEDMIRWNEPSWLDERLQPIDVAGRLAALRAADEEDEPSTPMTIGSDVASAILVERAGDGPRVDQSGVAERVVEQQQPEIASAGDWIDNLGTAGLPEPGSDPLAAPVRLAPLPTEPADRFELIWPSGDIDEQFGAPGAKPFPHPDIDRAGVTARLTGRGVKQSATAGAAVEEPPPVRVAGDDIESWLEAESDRDAITDEVVLAVRRAVASIDTGSLAARRRLVDVPAGPRPAETSMGLGNQTLPGRVAVRPEGEAIVPVTRAGAVTGTSVFDNLPPVASQATTEAQTRTEASVDEEASGEAQRASALRRLIGSIRRR